jgi:DNA-binding NtrC family response regulator
VELKSTTASRGDLGTTEGLPPIETLALGGARISVLVFGRDDLHVAELGDGDSVVVGRAVPAEVRVPDPSLSRKHARFTRRGDVVTVEDLGSRNGTWLDGRRIDQARLGSGASVLLGKVAASVHVATPAGAAMAGLESHDRWLARLDAELVRARSFRRPLAVIMLRSRAPSPPSAAAFCDELRHALRAVDVIGTHGPGAVMILAPELGSREARELGERLCAAAPSATPAVAGLPVFPESASSAHELVYVALQACQRAMPAQPAAVARARSVSSSSPPPPAEESSRFGVYASGRMQQVRALLHRLADRKLPVLVLGETGTGKELAARELHVAGARRDGPLRVVNCASLPENLVESTLFGHERGAFTGADRARAGLFEEAHEGTVFLDEVGELSRAAQASLLRVLETHKITRVGGSREIDVDVRVVAATHRDLEAMAQRGDFRLDLLHRLNAVTVELPPLRERAEDIVPLVSHFLAQAVSEWGGDTTGIDADALEVLQRYAWPGNIRELRNVLARAVAIADGDRIKVHDLPDRVRDGAPAKPAHGAPPMGRVTQPLDLREHLRQVERDLVLGALERTGGNQRQAAELLGLPQRTFERRLAALRDP